MKCLSARRHVSKRLLDLCADEFDLASNNLLRRFCTNVLPYRRIVSAITKVCLTWPFLWALEDFYEGASFRLVHLNLIWRMLIMLLGGVLRVAKGCGL